MSVEPLPPLVDRRTLAAETGLPRSVVDAIFRELPVIVFTGAPRKVLVKRADALALIARSTFSPGERVR